MSIGSVGMSGPRFYRGVRQITRLYNQYAAEPVGDRQMYKIIARARRQGVDLVGRDGTVLVAEEAKFLNGLLKISNAA
jgi:hypothetical protein